MRAVKFASGWVKAVNYRLGLMGITWREYASHFEEHSCNPQDLLALNKLVGCIPVAGKVLEIPYPVYRVDGDCEDSVHVEVVDVTLSVFISVLVHPFFWYDGETPPELKRVVEINNTPNYNYYAYTSSETSQPSLLKSFSLLKELFSKFQPYLSSKPVNRTKAEDLPRVLGGQFSTIPIAETLNMLSWAGFHIYKDSMVFPSYNYSVGLISNIKGDAFYDGYKGNSAELLNLKCRRCDGDITELYSYDAINQNCGDSFDYENLDNYCSAECYDDGTGSMHGDSWEP